MSTYSLSNGKVTIRVHSFGAELCSIKRNDSEKEYLWNADPAFWKRSSPVLFPFVGSLQGKAYKYKGMEYPMGQHGFARDMEFRLEKDSDTEIVFSLEYTPETLQKYPFKFRLEIAYELRDYEVVVKWKVQNLDTEEMYFSIGGHPAFMCPLDGDGQRTAYRIGFWTADGGVPEQIISRQVGKNSLLTDKEKIYDLSKGQLAVTQDLFDDDALVIENSQVNAIGLVDPHGKTYLKVCFDAPLVGVWSQPGIEVPFICIEPWYGRCDADDFTGTLEERKWGNHLGAKEEWTASYSILLETE